MWKVPEWVCSTFQPSAILSDVSLRSDFSSLPVLKAGLSYATEAFSFLPNPVTSLLLLVRGSVTHPAAQLRGALSHTSCPQLLAKACPLYLHKSSPLSIPTSTTRFKPPLCPHLEFHHNLPTGNCPQNVTLNPPSHCCQCDLPKSPIR